MSLHALGRVSEFLTNRSVSYTWSTESVWSFGFCSITQESPDPVTSLTGVQTLEVPAYGTKEYVLRVYASKEGKFKAAVRFFNPANREFVLFNVHVDVKEADVIDTITVRHIR